MADIFSIACDALPGDVTVVSIKGHEGLSEIYRFEVGLLTADAGFDFRAAVRARATIHFHLGDDAPPYTVNGVFAAVEHLHSWDGKSLYRALLVPQLWQSLLTRHSRVFTDLSVPDILKLVLEASGLTNQDFDLRLQSNYPAHDFIAQYKESNYAFMARWMEREGLYYFFEHGEEREKLVITDSLSFHEDQPGGLVRYVADAAEDYSSAQAFDRFVCKSMALPAKIELIDYDYLNPALNLVGKADVGQGFGEISSYGEGFTTGEDGNRLAKLRAEELKAQENVFTGTGLVHHLRTGYRFQLDEHPVGAFNAGYLTTQLEHRGNQAANDAKIRSLLGIDFDNTYEATVTAIPAEVQYRHPRKTEWPRVEGFEGAVVCGTASSEYAQIDDHGRYKVRIKFDESDLDDGTASTWVRMQQPHGGSNEGFHFPLRKGTEVLLFFSGGNPDMPVIAGVVPNTVTPSPVLANNHTLNVIQTGGLNLIELDDSAGAQYVYVYSPTANSYLHLGCGDFQVVLNTTGHAHFNFLGDQVIDIGVSLTETVQSDVTFNYNANWLVNVVADTTIEICGVKSLHVVGDVTYNFDALWTVCVLGDTKIDLAANLNIDVGGVTVENYGGNVTVNVDGDHIINVTGNTNHTVTNNYEFNVTNNYTQNITANYNTTVNASYTQNVSANVNVNVGGSTDESFWSFHAKINGGVTSDTFLGIKNENCIGAKIEAILGMKAEGHLGVKVECVAAPTITLAPNGTETIATYIGCKLLDLQQHVSWLNTSAISIHL